MKNFKVILAALFLMLGVVVASADGVVWLSSVYDFGSFKEIEGPKTGHLSFVNRGPEPTIINRVKPTCGCTVADYPHDIIEPGDTATVSFTYNPAGRPGRFDKSIKVYIGEEGKAHIIRIKGTVIGSPETLAGQYPVVAGPLRLNKKQINLGDVRYGTARHEFLHGYNQSRDTIYPAWKDVPESISMGISDRAVAPGDLVSITLYFNSRDESELGDMVRELILVADERGKEDEVKISLFANLVPDTSSLTPEQVANGPRIAVDPEIVVLDKKHSSGSVDFSFEVRNEGKSTMKINRIYSKDSSIHIKRFPAELGAGKKAKVKGTINLDGLDDVFSQRIEILSSDPLNPVKTVRVSGERE